MAVNEIKQTATEANEAKKRSSKRYNSLYIICVYGREMHSVERERERLAQRYMQGGAFFLLCVGDKALVYFCSSARGELSPVATEGWEKLLSFFKITRLYFHTIFLLTPPA